MSLFWLMACLGTSSSTDRSLVVAAYTTPREVMNERIVPAFEARWREQTGESLHVEASYQGSGAQSRAVEGGLEADVVWLSLDPDVARLERAGLVDASWREGPTGGIVSSSVVAIGTRPGNPHGLADWSDLARADLDVLTPNVRTSGGAMWNVLALSAAGGEPLLSGVLRRVKVMDKGARESMLTFEKGVGDAIITYENEVVVARRAGKGMDYVVPPRTIRIENPAAVVREVAKRRGTEGVAEAFVAFLLEPAQQRAMAEYGLRPVVDGVPTPDLPPLGDVVTVQSMGGWDAVTKQVFGDGGAYDRALDASRASP